MNNNESFVGRYGAIGVSIFLMFTNVSKRYVPETEPARHTLKTLINDGYLQPNQSNPDMFSVTQKGDVLQGHIYKTLLTVGEPQAVYQANTLG